MTQIKTDLGNTRESARRIRFEPFGAITSTDVQSAIQQAISLPQLIIQTPVIAGQSPYTVQATDTFLAVDTTAGPVTILMPSGVLRGGIPVTVKDAKGNASVNAISVVPIVGETIDGFTNANPYPMDSNFTAVKFDPQTGGYLVDA